jgi:hypothetical protein
MSRCQCESCHKSDGAKRCLDVEAARWALWEGSAPDPTPRWLSQALLVEVEVEVETEAVAHGHELPLSVPTRGGAAEALRLCSVCAAHQHSPGAEGAGEVWTLRQGELGAAAWIPWRDCGANTSGALHRRAEMEGLIRRLWRAANVQVPQLSLRRRRVGRQLVSGALRRLRRSTESSARDRPFALSLCSCPLCRSPTPAPAQPKPPIRKPSLIGRPFDTSPSTPNGRLK